VALAANGNGGDDNNDVWNRLPDFQITVQGTPPPPPDPGSITVTNPTGGERYHPGDTVNITWNATAPIVRIPSIRGLKKTEQAQSEDDEAEDESEDESDDDSDDESDDDSDDESDDESDDDSDDESDDDGDDDSDDDGDDDSDDDDSSDDSDSTGTGGGTGGGSGGNDSTGTGGGTGGGTDTTAAGNFVQIEWSSTGSQGPWNLLADSVAMNDERFRWIVPNILTEDAWVKITRVDIDTVFGMNPAAFAIVAEDSSSGGGGSDTTGSAGGGGDDSTQVTGIVIAHPAENEIVPTGAAYLITWTSRASQLVNLQWDQCGEGWTTIAEGVQAAKGRHLWNVPLHADGDARVRVVDAANTTDVLEVSKTFLLRSSTTDVNDDMTSMTVQLAPQPVTAGDDLQVRLGSVGASTVTLWSITGAPVYGPTTVTGEHFAIAIPNALSAGAYLLTIEGAGSTQRLPVFINR